MSATHTRYKITWPWIDKKNYNSRKKHWNLTTLHPLSIRMSMYYPTKRTVVVKSKLKRYECTSLNTNAAMKSSICYRNKHLYELFKMKKRPTLLKKFISTPICKCQNCNSNHWRLLIHTDNPRLTKVPENLNCKSYKTSLRTVHSCTYQMQVIVSFSWYC